MLVVLVFTMSCYSANWFIYFSLNNRRHKFWAQHPQILMTMMPAKKPTRNVMRRRQMRKKFLKYMLLPSDMPLTVLNRLCLVVDRWPSNRGLWNSWSTFSTATISTPSWWSIKASLNITELLIIDTFSLQNSRSYFKTCLLNWKGCRDSMRE